LHRNLIKTANALARRTPSRPLNSDSRRAISTAYYAMFHCLCKFCADNFIGSVRAGRTERAWAQTYRALNHGAVKNACKRWVEQLGTGAGFPQEILDFADFFVTMQQARHDADYNPLKRYTRQEVLLLISGAQIAILNFESADLRHKKAFAALILFGSRK